MTDRPDLGVDADYRLTGGQSVALVDQRGQRITLDLPMDLTMVAAILAFTNDLGFEFERVEQR